MLRPGDIHIELCFYDNYYQAPKPRRTNTISSSTRSSASTRHKGKEIAKSITPQSESVSDEDSDPEQALRDKDMQKNLALLAKYFKKLYKPNNNNLQTSSKLMETRIVVQQNGIQCFNCKGFGHYAKEYRKPKRVKGYSYHMGKDDDVQTSDTGYFHYKAGQLIG
ncbi:hypothetical protein Tco_0558702 [Tanacetum coccineum]